MKKKSLCLFLFRTSVLAFLLASCSRLPSQDPDSGTEGSAWIHYPHLEATTDRNGIREYWEAKNGKYRFSMPESSNITEADGYDTSSFGEDDPRYIKYIADDLSAFYIAHSRTFDFSEASCLTGYRPTEISLDVGKSSRLEFLKDDESPAYSANCLAVSDVISSNDDLSALQARIDEGIVSGHYVFTADLVSPTTYVSNTADGIGKFSGTIDGRGHTVTSPVFWGRRMLGELVGATIENLAFTGISAFSVLAVTLTDTLVKNVNFIASSVINTWSNVGMICDDIYGTTCFDHCSIDFGENYHLFPAGSHKTAPVAMNNMTKKRNVTFIDTVIRCLPTVTIFLQDAYGRSLRPTDGITYVDTYRFVDNGKLNYAIRYPEDDTLAASSAAELGDAIEECIGRAIPVIPYHEDQVFNTGSANIVLGSAASLENAYIPVPGKTGEYVVKTAGKAIYIDATDETGWKTAVIRFLSLAFGYNYLSDDISVNKVTDRDNVSISPIDLGDTAQFEYNRADFGDGYHGNVSRQGYNVTGFTKNDIFIDVPGDNGDPYLNGSEKFHTMLRILYPETYLQDHGLWFATDSSGNLPEKYSGSYWNWQLCFTAHGNLSEYAQMVTQAADNIIAVFAKNTNLSCNGISFSIMDNDFYCHCESCKEAESDYGSKAGSLVRFVNDVAEAVNSDVSSTKRDRIIFTTSAYMAYESAPVKNGGATIKTADDVYVMLAPIYANYAYSIGDAEHNPTSYTMFENWSKAGPIHSWLYDTNFSHYLYPLNSFRATTESITYMKEKGVKMAYIEGQHNLASQRRTGFNEFKIYLNGKYMIDCNQDFDALKDDFFRGYYGSAYLDMLVFYNELTERMETFETDSTLHGILTKNGTLRSIYAAIDDTRLWDRDQLVRWMNLCLESYAKETDPKIKEHILQESIFPRFALCTGFASTYSSEELLALRQSFKKDADSLGIVQTSEGTSSSISSYYSAWGL